MSELMNTRAKMAVETGGSIAYTPPTIRERLNDQIINYKKHMERAQEALALLDKNADLERLQDLLASLN